MTIATGNVRLEEPKSVCTGTLAPGDWVRFSIRDTGVGIDESVRAHLFEPFFTTKPQGQGTGLGLAMVYGIVNQSGGQVQVESAPGEGTSVNVYLPRHRGGV